MHAWHASHALRALQALRAVHAWCALPFRGWAGGSSLGCLTRRVIAAMQASPPHGVRRGCRIHCDRASLGLR